MKNANKFMSSDKTELGIFWLDNACSEILHYRTVIEEDIDKTDPAEYSFLHDVEWARHPPGIPGSYNDYPRGRIFPYGGIYHVELTIEPTPQIKAFIRRSFNLPLDTEFYYKGTFE
jgi:hypothetical protein